MNFVVIYLFRLWKYDLVTCSDEVHKKYHVRHMLVFKINIRVYVRRRRCNNVKGERAEVISLTLSHRLEKHIESGQDVTHAIEVMRTYSQQVYQSKSHQMTADFQLEKQQYKVAPLLLPSAIFILPAPLPSSLFFHYKVQDVPQKQPQGLAASMSLYTFQLHAVDWMRSIEEKQDHGIALLPLSFRSTSYLLQLLLFIKSFLQDLSILIC